MSLEQPVKQLLVDLDGTLLGNRNVSLSIDFIRQSIAAMTQFGGVRNAVSTLLAIQKVFNSPSPKETNDVRVVELCAKKLKISTDEARQFLRQNLLRIFPTLERHFFPVEGSREFLEWAHRLYPMILATNPVWPPEIVELRVKWAGIDPNWFSRMTHIRTMNACKPSQQFYRQILKEENLRAQDCLLIGDDKKMDLPATLVGIRVFIVGPYKKLTSLRPPGARAAAWRGNYADLRSLLQSTP